MTLKILVEDESIIVIDKPAQVPVYPPTPGEIDTDTVAGALLARFPFLAKIGPKPVEAGLLHRLDNDTSGCLLAAKTKTAYQNLRDQFESGAVVKTYQALVIGHTPSGGRITAPIAHHPKRKERMVACATPADAEKRKARPAQTDYAVLAHYPNYTFLLVRILTGVRHQIRAHLASIGYPIAGDKLYRAAKHKRLDSLNVSRHFLHAAQIGFHHPNTGAWMEIQAPLSPDLENVIDRLERGP